MITNPWLEIDDAGGRARSIAHYTVLQRRETLPLQPIIAGHYEHRYERRPECDVSQHVMIEIPSQG